MKVGLVGQQWLRIINVRWVDTQQEKNKNPLVEGQGVVYTCFLSYNAGVNTREVH